MNMSNDRICIMFMVSVLVIILFEKVKSNKDGFCSGCGNNRIVARIMRPLKTLNRISARASARAAGNDDDENIAQTDEAGNDGETTPTISNALAGTLEQYKAAQNGMPLPKHESNCVSARIVGNRSSAIIAQHKAEVCYDATNGPPCAMPSYVSISAVNTGDNSYESSFNPTPDPEDDQNTALW